MLPSFVPCFSAFIVDERYRGPIFVGRYVEPLRSYALPIDGGSAKFEVLFSRQNLRGGVKNFESTVFKALPHQLVCKFRHFRGDPLRDG